MQSKRKIFFWFEPNVRHFLSENLTGEMQRVLNLMQI